MTRGFDVPEAANCLRYVSDLFFCLLLWILFPVYANLSLSQRWTPWAIMINPLSKRDPIISHDPPRFLIACAPIGGFLFGEMTQGWFAGFELSNWLSWLWDHRQCTVPHVMASQVYMGAASQNSHDMLGRSKEPDTQTRTIGLAHIAHLDTFFFSFFTVWLWLTFTCVARTKCLTWWFLSLLSWIPSDYPHSTVVGRIRIMEKWLRWMSPRWLLRDTNLSE